MKARILHWAVALILIGVWLAFRVHGCEGDHARVRQVLYNAGYPQVLVKGAAGFRCPGELFSNEFMAISREGRLVEGVVCCVPFGCGGTDCIVRFDYGDK